MKLKRLTDAEFDQAEKLAKSSGVPLTECPTCGSKIEMVEEGIYGRENGTYKYKGEVHDCDCDTQMALRKHYILARIPEQYMRLDFAADYRKPEVKEYIRLYLEKWNSFRKNGMGIELGGPALGTGKTFGATHVGKELVKLGHSVRFIRFTDVISLFEKEDGEKTEELLKSAEVLILDEVKKYISERQGSLYSEKFESLIRHRTDWNLPTIMTTNLTEEELRDHYARVYSLLEAKQMRIEMTGDDARMGQISLENMELVMNDEVRPIT